MVGADMVGADMVGTNVVGADVVIANAGLGSIETNGLYRKSILSTIVVESEKLLFISPINNLNSDDVLCAECLRSCLLIYHLAPSLANTIV